MCVMPIEQFVKNAINCIHWANLTSLVFSTFFHVKLANYPENGLLADFLSRKRSKALIYKGLSCYDLTWSFQSGLCITHDLY